MGSGGWFKTIVGRKKTKKSKSGKEPKGEVASASTAELQSEDHVDSNNNRNAGSSTVRPIPIPLTEDAAATRIQAAFRSYKARRILRHLKGTARLITITQSSSMKKQTMTATSYLQLWHKIQSEISSRRRYMVTEGREKQRKLETQLKLEAKLQDIEAEWCGGSETKEEIVSRIQQREEAAFKRERALAYAFSHQWRANSGQSCSYDFGKGEWGWSWMDRWVAARPWETRANSQHPSLGKAQIAAGSKTKKGNPVSQKPASILLNVEARNVRGPMKRLSYPMSAGMHFTSTVSTASKIKSVKSIQESSKIQAAA